MYSYESVIIREIDYMCIANRILLEDFIQVSQTDEYYSAKLENIIKDGKLTDEFIKEDDELNETVDKTMASSNYNEDEFMKFIHELLEKHYN